VVTLAPPFLPGWLVTGRSLALEMLRAGVGTTYEQAGAEYGKYGKDEFVKVEAEARYVFLLGTTLWRTHFLYCPLELPVEGCGNMAQRWKHPRNISGDMHKEVLTLRLRAEVRHRRRRIR